MSHQENDKIFESARERFWEVMGDYDFQQTICEHFLSAQDQWKEKEYGFNEDPYDNAFEILWNWDCEALSVDIEECVNQYIKHKKKKDYEKQT